MTFRITLCLPVALVVATVGAAESPCRDKPDPPQLVVLGGSLSAGIGDFALGGELQDRSFVALVAQRLGSELAIPKIEPPGIAPPAGLAAQPTIVPALGQTFVVAPTGTPLDNLAIPGLTVADALRLRPSEPLIQRDDPRQTLANLVLFAAVPRAAAGALTPVDAAAARGADVAIVELGYEEAIAAAVGGSAALLPAPSAFRADYAAILARLRRSGATVVATTIPDPLDTAYFSSLGAAGRLLRIEPSLLAELYGLREGDRLALPGLLAAGHQLTGRKVVAPLPPGSVLDADAAAELAAGIDRLNTVVREVAREHRTAVLDLHQAFAAMRQNGIVAGDRVLSADFLGGIYLLNGLYPGRTGHAFLADRLLRVLDPRARSGYDRTDFVAVAREDPATLSRTAEGRLYRREDLFGPLPPPPLPPLPAADPSVMGFLPASLDPACRPPAGVPACGLPPLADVRPIVLPSDRKVVLELDPAASYYGDAIRAVDCPHDRPLPGFEAFPAFGSCQNLLFGGFAMSDVALRGKVRLTFAEPVEGWSHFTIEHPEGLVGEDGRLAAPQLFTLPLERSLLRDIPGLVSSGELNLHTGEIRGLQYFTSIFNTALVALKGVNPGLPFRPLGFPGPAGSAIARIRQRDDGRLSFSLYVTQFLPLGVELAGETVRLPLPLCGPELDCASIAARGTSLHPNLYLSTEPPPEPPTDAAAPELPENAVEELVVSVAESHFGDLFDLAVPELGGAALGASPLLGRLQVQFGPRFGHRQPVAVTTLPPGGLGAPLPELVGKLPAGTLPGLAGFDGELVFPERTYRLQRLRLTSDPWNVALGVVDTRSGRFLGEHLHRALVVQDLIFELFAAEPCTPKTSFCYLGAATFERLAGGGMTFRFEGRVRIPYPAGYRFPAPRPPGGAFVVERPSILEPFVRFTAHASAEHPGEALTGRRRWRGAQGGEVDVEYTLPCGAAGPELIFKLRDAASGGRFHADELVWSDCTSSGNGPDASRVVDIVTFTAHGTWSRGGTTARHTVSGQIHQGASDASVALRVGDADAPVLQVVAPAETKAAEATAVRAEVRPE